MAEYEAKQELAVELAVHWAKTGLRQFSMRDAVNDFMEEVGANNAMSDESIIDRRRICAQQLTIKSIAFLSKDELHKVEQELLLVNIYMSMCLDDVWRCINHFDKEQLSTSAQEHLFGKSKVTMVISAQCNLISNRRLNLIVIII